MDPNKNIKTACIILLPIIIALGYTYFKKQKVQSDYFLVDIQQLEFFSKQICLEAPYFQQQDDLVRLINTIESQKGDFKNQLKSDSITLIESLKKLYRSYQSQTSTALYTQQLEQRLSDCPANINKLQYEIKIKSKDKQDWEGQIKRIQLEISNLRDEIQWDFNNKSQMQANISGLTAEITRLRQKMTGSSLPISTRDIQNEIDMKEREIKSENELKISKTNQILQLNQSLNIDLNSQKISLEKSISVISSLDTLYQDLYSDINSLQQDMTKTFYQFKQENLDVLELRNQNLQYLKSIEQQQEKQNEINKLLIEVTNVRQNFQQYFENFDIRYLDVFNTRADNQTLQNIKDRMKEANLKKANLQADLDIINDQIRRKNLERQNLKLQVDAISKKIISLQVDLQELRNQLEQKTPQPINQQSTIDQYQRQILQLESDINFVSEQIKPKEDEISRLNRELNGNQQKVRNLQSEIDLLDQQLTQKIKDCLRAKKKHKELADKLSQTNLTRKQMKDDIRKIIDQINKNIESRQGFNGYPSQP